MYKSFIILSCKYDNSCKHVYLYLHVIVKCVV